MRLSLDKFQVTCQICRLCINTIEEIFVEPEKHTYAVHASKVTRATAVLAFSVMSASHKDLASGGECGVEL